MENKEIIIDGVDVSGCRYLFDDTSYKRSKTSCSITLKDCKYLGNNCYYKQRKKYSSALKEIGKLSENAYCLTNGTNKDMAEFAKTIMIKVNEVLNAT